MALINASKSSSKTSSKPSNSSKNSAVQKLARSGNVAAQNYLKTGKVGNANDKVTDSKGNSLSLTRDSSGKATGIERTPTSVITAQSLDTTKPNIKTPTPAVTPVTDFASNNIALSGGDTGLTTSGNQLVPTPTPATPPKTALSDYQEQFAELEMPSAASIQRKLEKEQGLEQKRQDVNNYAGQINTIVANRDADLLRLRQSGSVEGVTEAVYGGQETTVNREAAIRALPVQAQLAAAQGNLKLAEDHIATWGSILITDATNKYNAKKEMLRSAFDYAVGKEKEAVAALEKKNDRAYAESQNNISTARQAALQAMEYGQTSLMKAFTALDSSSPTFNKDYNTLLAQLKKPVVATASPKRDTSFDANGNLVDMQTGEIIRSAGGVGTADATQKSLDQFTFLRETITGAKKLAGKAGPNLITQWMGNAFVGDTGVKQLQKKLDTLKVNLLTLNTDPNVKKFFGPQMTERDTELMTSAGTTMDAYVNSPVDLTAELVRYDNLINRMETAVKNGQSLEGKSGGNLMTGGDGLTYIIVD